MVSTSHPQRSQATTRDPQRAQERILTAAMAEFSAKGFAGARVDSIARRARINKRMLYHYFGNKEDLFRAILQRKLAQRAEWVAKAPDDPIEALAYWFDLARQDMDWIRLLQWEALQTGNGKLINEEKRLANIKNGIANLRRSQAKGLVSRELDPQQMLLAMISLTTYPLAFPQITRLVTGLSVTDPEFRKRRVAFLQQFAAAFRPKGKSA
ncbi:MAG: TetR/AcrR family transcriptional regulator [Verrucomicrobia bacterium]|nr:TetR/AcrR family transcriptional regulator [Verrucomicrobiota bacterium]